MRTGRLRITTRTSGINERLLKRHAFSFLVGFLGVFWGLGGSGGFFWVLGGRFLFFFFFDHEAAKTYVTCVSFLL